MAGPVLRRGIYYFRRRVPKDMLPVVGSWVLARSLKTNKFSLAMVRYGQLLTATEHLYSTLRMADTPDTETLKAIFHKGLRISLGLQEPDGGGFAAPIPHDPNESEADILEFMKNEDDELKYVGRDMADSNPDLSPFKPGLCDDQFRQIGMLRLRSAREHLLQMKRLKSHGTVGPAFDSYFAEVFLNDHQPPETSRRVPSNTATSLFPTPSGPPKEGHSLKETYEAFRKEEGKDWNKRQYKFDEGYRILADLFGADRDITEITPADVRRAKDLISKLPRNGSNHPKYQPLSYEARVRRAQKDKEAVVSAETANAKLGHISLWFKWAKENLYLEQNLFEGVKVKKPKDAANKRTPTFSDEQLRTLFSCPVYTGMKSWRQWFEPGEVIERNAKYWAPLIAVHTGVLPP